MENWEKSLNVFLNNFENKKDIIGVLVCGSYITGNPNSHSDLDVHVILDEEVEYRQRGNVIVDGLIIEYFSNTPKQIIKYFEEDYKAFRLMSQTQFITGKIIYDKNSEILKLKEIANKYYKNYFNDVEYNITELEKYGLWDKLDDLQSLYKENAPEFDFVYYNNLNYLLERYMKLNKFTYTPKTILGQLTSEIVRKKYLLKELNDENASIIIQNCITNSDKKIRLENYESLTRVVYKITGGFEIDGFKFKSRKDI